MNLLQKKGNMLLQLRKSTAKAVSEWNAEHWIVEGLSDQSVWIHIIQPE